MRLDQSDCNCPWRPGMTDDEIRATDAYSNINLLIDLILETGGKDMSTSTVLKIVGIILVCVGIHFGLGWPLPLVVFGCGLGFLFLP